MNFIMSKSLRGKFYYKRAVDEMLTKADEGIGGVSQKLTIADEGEGGSANPYFG